MPKTNNSHYLTFSAMDGEITRFIIPNFQKLEKCPACSRSFAWKCFNPYFNGRYSATMLEQVTILSLQCFNSCFGGRHSATLNWFIHGATIRCFNPCFIGRYSATLHDEQELDWNYEFQSLFLWRVLCNVMYYNNSTIANSFQSLF